MNQRNDPLRKPATNSLFQRFLCRYILVVSPTTHNGVALLCDISSKLYNKVCLLSTVNFSNSSITKPRAFFHPDLPCCWSIHLICWKSVIYGFFKICIFDLFICQLYQNRNHSHPHLFHIDIQLSCYFSKSGTVISLN